MKGRGKINLTIDLLMFLTFTLIGGIGFLMKYTLPLGRELILKFGENSKLFFLGLDRHQWGTIHLTAAYVLIALLVLHIIFHWKAIGVLISQAVPSLLLRRALVAGFVVLGSGLLLFSFVVNPEKSQGDNFLHRNPSFNKGPAPASDSPEISNQAGSHNMGEKPGELNKNEQRDKTSPELQEKHGDREKVDSLQGKMSIADASRLYGISTLEVKKRLRIPDEVSDNETIGRLRRTYGFTMTQARERLEKKQ